MGQAAARSAVTTTPLPAARPSSLTTPGVAGRRGRSGPRRHRDRQDPRPSRCPRCEPRCRHPWQVLEPSIRAACPDGPKQAIPAARTASAARGPREPQARWPPDRPSCAWRGRDVLGGPGVDVDLLGQCRGAGVARGDRRNPPQDRRNAVSRACSRAPEPITRTRTPQTLNHHVSTNLPPGRELPASGCPARAQPVTTAQHHRDQARPARRGRRSSRGPCGVLGQSPPAGSSSRSASLMVRTY